MRKGLCKRDWIDTNRIKSDFGDEKMGFTGADAILTNLCDLMQLLTKRYTRNKTIQH